ncbi:hypothetical protein [Bartonella sp. AU18XJBT]|uniref:hypothetical protein n=1 Tax=Bartonella sp. AU18XJBT TaxID=3019089 RepID=UPI0023627F35|nr:hypothetical protein [Bartonella sp. AU18XJBT]
MILSPEISNNLLGDVVNFLRMLQRHYRPFMKNISISDDSREEFQRLIQQDPETFTDLERASRFLYLQRLSFREKVNRTMRVETHRNARGLKPF